MEYGAHLPLIDVDGRTHSLGELRDFAAVAAGSGYRVLCANDHLLFSRPWLDGLTALAAVIDDARDVTLTTTVCLPVIRGPVQAAKTLATIDVLSGGRLIVGVGPGSSARDYAAAGLPFDDRWRRFEEATAVLRGLLRTDGTIFEGEFYSTADIVIEPPPLQRPGPPIWIGSWGSRPGLRRVARLGDGWLASGYNTTPDAFREGLSYLSDRLTTEGKEPAAFANGLATMWLYVTEDRATAEQMITERLSPLLNRPPETLLNLPLPIGSAEVCATRLAAYADAGVQHLFVWPLGDELEQLEIFQEHVVPLVEEMAPMDRGDPQ
jgi:alkanesulfonate monooxygenase SsuD/methylene tetrahydromethanopterin reductase-like flavin-dependent oxidoreductase (luciferase family)